LVLPVVHGLPQETVVANSNAPSVVGLSDGRLLAVENCYWYPTGTMAVIVQGICEEYSNDKGLTWGNEISVINSTAEYKDYNRLVGGYEEVFSGLFLDGNKILLFYMRWVSYDPNVYENCTIWKLESYDNGLTWVNDSRIDLGTHDYEESSYAAIKMRDGRLILPISWENANVPYISSVSVLYSDDDGETWKEGGQVPNWNYSSTGLDEPSVVELSNGSLYCLMRTYGYGEGRVHAYSISNDGGLTWSQVKGVPMMVSFNTTPALLRYSWNPNIILVAWINRSEGRDYQDRRPLVIAYSHDDCASWQGITTLDDGIGNGSLYSLNEERFSLADGYIFLGVHRNNDLALDSGESVFIRFTLSLDYDLFDLAFGSQRIDGNWNPYMDMNHDGTINILDAILFDEQLI
jgi:Neuraminidase (sialidase)